MKMSFYDGTLDRSKAIEIIKNTEREIKYTYGLSYRNPTTYKVPISKEKALEIIKEESLLDIDFKNFDYIDINAYSANDLF